MTGPDTPFLYTFEGDFDIDMTLVLTSRPSNETRDALGVDNASFW